MSGKIISRIRERERAKARKAAEEMHYIFVQNSIRTTGTGYTVGAIALTVAMCVAAIVGGVLAASGRI